MKGKVSGDFSQGPIPSVILRMALPLMAAQLVNILYNIVDRIYIGNIPVTGSLALAGVGITAPVITAVSAFTGLLGSGGMPLCAIARGRGDDTEAERVMGNACSLLLIASVLIMGLVFCLMDLILRLFGAGTETLPYAREYLRIYLLGTPFVMIGIGMNSYINVQGFPRRGMLTVMLGALANILLDPIFIFTLNMGVEGAALATVLSQLLSAVWCLGFLLGRKTPLNLNRHTMRLQREIVGKIVSLGSSNFVMKITNALVHALANRQLGAYGGDLYVSAYVILSSLGTLFQDTVPQIAIGMQPVVGFNYGAGLRKRVLESINFTLAICFGISFAVWAVFMLCAHWLVRAFTPDAELVVLAARSVRLFFCAMPIMTLQAVSQSVFQGLGQAKKAAFFAILRKVILIVPLMFLLPRLWGLGAEGVFLSEPVSDTIGSLASFTTMLLTVYLPTRRALREETIV